MLEIRCLESTRLDKYLTDYLSISRSKVQKMIKDGLVTVNGKVASSGNTIKVDDLIIVQEIEENDNSIKPQDIPIDIVYEDNDIMIINKESGMVVHPAPGHYKDTLVNAILNHCDIKCGEEDRPGIVHRLDKDTSGLMVVAKSEAAYTKLVEMLANREVERHYLAIVDGIIKNDSGKIDAPIGRDNRNRQKMAVTADNSKEAVTNFKVLDRYVNNTLLECVLETGRTHQIRVHMRYIGYPVNNDPLYGRGKPTEFGQMLHSKSIKFKHPVTGKDLYFEVDPPKEFMDKINSLEEERKSLESYQSIDTVDKIEEQS